jgi:hypothetical protein
MYNRIAFMAVAAILLTAIMSIALFNSKVANAQNTHIIITKRSNMRGGLPPNASVPSQNQTGMILGANITGSIPIGPIMAKAIASQIHVSLANASTTAEKAVGPNAHSVAVRIGTVRGLLVYMALVNDVNTGTFHGVLVDPGTGKVLASIPFPFSALGMIGPNMIGPNMIGPNMIGPNMMGPGMMKGSGMMSGYP